jgi:hypothetical protein
MKLSRITKQISLLFHVEHFQVNALRPARSACLAFRASIDKYRRAQNRNIRMNYLFHVKQFAYLAFDVLDSAA